MPIDPNQDTAYLSFRRSLGFDDADLQAVTARRKASLFRQQQYRLPELADQYEDASENVRNDYAARGIFSSGHRVKAAGTVLNRHTRQVGKEQTEYADEVGGLDLDLARQLAARQRKLAEEAIEARQRLAMDAAAVGQR